MRVWAPPTTRLSTTSNRSSNAGAGKPCPHAVAATRRARSSESSPTPSVPSVSTTRSRSAAVSHSVATFSKAAANRANSASAIVSPAANAWPPKRLISPCSRFATRSSASRMWKPAIERPEPRSSPALPGAKTIAGRWKRSLRRDATMPTTPWCHVGRYRQSVEPPAFAASAVAPSRSASASSCIETSTSRRSRLSRSSSDAIARASSGSSVTRQRMPTVMSARRPAALSRGPATKPRSLAVARAGSRPATRNSASMPGCARPARMRRRPCSTRMRFAWSSRTTSATVPSATRSSKAARFGPSPLSTPCSRNRARVAAST